MVSEMNCSVIWNGHFNDPLYSHFAIFQPYNFRVDDLLLPGYNSKPYPFILIENHFPQKCILLHQISISIESSLSQSFLKFLKKWRIGQQKTHHRYHLTQHFFPIPLPLLPSFSIFLTQHRNLILIFLNNANLLTLPYNFPFTSQSIPNHPIRKIIFIFEYIPLHIIAHPTSNYGWRSHVTMICL